MVNDKTGKIRKPTDNKSGKGYLYVDLYNRGKHKKFYVHRLVANAFVEKRNNKQYVNHIDGNPKNNNYKNLEWCTPRENVEHAAKVLKVMSQYRTCNEKRKKQIQGTYISNGEKTIVFSSVREASAALGIHSSNIVCNLKGRQSHTKGITWCYVEEIK